MKPSERMSARQRVKYETRQHYSAEHVRYYQRRMYASSHMRHYLQARNSALSEFLTECRERKGERLRILEVGCGPGLSLSDLGRDSGQQLVGIDYSLEMLRLARENTAELTPRPSVLRASAFQLPFGDETFDFVYATRFIHMFRDKKPVLDELRRVTHRNGLLVVEFYRRPYHVIRWLAGRHPVALSSFLYHYPRLAEVNALMGTPVRIRPLRFGGERLLRLVFEEAIVRRILERCWTTPLRLAIDEYLVAIPGKLR